MKTIKVYLENSASSLATNFDFTQIVIAGSHIFKLFSISEDALTEKLNLYVSKVHNQNFSSNDVIWNPVEENKIATVATTGAIITWDLQKSGRSKQDLVFKDHERPVNKISYHPTDGSMLLAGLQGGLIKLFDTRKGEAMLSFSSNTESIRDIQFNPHINNFFATGTENGNIQFWDIRKPDRIEYQFREHRGPIFAIDWHPEFKMWIATASRDRTVKVWNLNDEKKQLFNSIRTVAAVGRIKWQPNKSYNIASCALGMDSSISVWDIRRPYIPFYAFHEHKDVTTDIAWGKDMSTLFSVSKDNTLVRHSLKDAMQPLESLNPIALDINPIGSIAHAKPKPDGSKSATELSRSSENYGPVLSRMTVNEMFKNNKNILKRNKKNNVTNHVTKKPDFAIRFNGNDETNHMIDNNYVTSQAKISSDVTNRVKWDSNVVSQANLLCGDVANQIIESAVNYKLTGRSFSDICEHNSTVARRLNRNCIVGTWQMIQTLYGENFDSSQSSSHRDDQRFDHLDSDQKSNVRHVSADGSADTGVVNSAEDADSEYDDTDNHDVNLMNIASGTTVGHDYFFGDDEINQLTFDYDNLNVDNPHEWILPKEAFQPRRNILCRPITPPPDDFDQNSSKNENGDEIILATGEDYVMASSVRISESNLEPVKKFEPSQLVVESLRYYAAIGDVQMAVTLVLVLGNKIKNLIDEATLEHWFSAYIEILHQLELWNTATQVINLAVNLPQIHGINQETTAVRLQCGSCSFSLPYNQRFCRKCGKIPTICSICHKVVEGLFVWCQECCHGGHLQHVMDWMSTNDLCPTGCGHKCQF